MDRFTARDENGQAFVDSHDLSVFADAMNRFAAYEDTGLEPAEIPTGFDLAKVFCAMKKLKQYKDLEQDGRFVVLPCKVGDTVFYPYCGRILEKKITKYNELLRSNGRLDIWYCVNCDDAETFGLEDVGKIVFLTREEAEAKLKGEANGTTSD